MDRAATYKIILCSLILLLTGCALSHADRNSNRWSVDALSQALANPSRSLADRDRDADREPAQLLTFFGVGRGMTAVDLIGENGYMTEVLSIAVGTQGTVYAQNPPVVFKMRDGAIDKALTARLADNRLANVIRVDSELPSPSIAPNSVDVAITAMNLHDIYNAAGRSAAEEFLKNVFAVLKVGGVCGVVDHVGEVGADNTKLHRMPKQYAIDAAKAAGFIVEAESDLLANATDDHTKVVFDPAVRGKTDQFVLRLRKPNQ